MTGRGKSWAEISEHRLTQNFRALRQAAGGETAVLSVIKADAYGHGAGLCARVLAQAGTDWLGVTDAAEGLLVQSALRDLRSATPGQAPPHILVLCGLLPDDAELLLASDLVPVVWTPEQVQWLAAAGRRLGRAHPGRVHLEVDTGMSRQGVIPGDPLRHMLACLRRERETLRLDGVLTHFASSEVIDSAQTASQRRRFEAALDAVAASELRPAWIHAGNTSALDNPAAVAHAAAHASWLGALAAMHGAQPMVRAGLALYGHTLPLEEAAPEVRLGGLRLVASAASREPAPAETQARLSSLAPVMTWKTRVLAVSAVEAGTHVGYNATFTAPRPMRLALLPVGYADGLRRDLSGSAAPGDEPGGGWVMLHAQRAPIVGRISMNLTTVDVSAIDGVAAGDDVTLLGPGIGPEVHAGLAGTIPYEILCGIRPTTRRLVP